MRLEDFPRPPTDNGRGVHWNVSPTHDFMPPDRQDYWIGELQAMKIKWVKVLDDSGGSSVALCQRMVRAGIMPVVRLYRQQPNPGHIGSREMDAIRRLVDVGVHYIETNNEPDLAAEWQHNSKPANWLGLVIDNFIFDADHVLALGALPALPAMGVGSQTNPVKAVVDRGRADLFAKGAWLAIHNYALNHPLDYPNDPVNQEGQQVSPVEYAALPIWAWDHQPRDLINGWRASDKNSGATLHTDSTCWRAFELADELATQALGYSVPIISTEGGVVMGWRDDRRYPRITPDLQRDAIVAISRFMQEQAPPYYFACCHWLIGNYRMGVFNPTWETNAWYTDWWVVDFGIAGQLPVVDALKALPSHSRLTAAGPGSITGTLGGSGFGPLAGVTVRLALSGTEVASAVTAADGSFHCANLALGAYCLLLDGYGPLAQNVMLTAERSSQVLNLEIPGHQSGVHGRALNRQGQAVGGVSVQLLGGAALLQATTDANGQFTFSGLSAGVYTLASGDVHSANFQVDGWTSVMIDLTVPNAAGYKYVVTTKRLVPATENGNNHHFYGRVLAANGQGLNGIRLRMSWSNAPPGTVFPETTTGHDSFKPDGFFEFINSPGLFQVSIIQGDYPSDMADNLDTAHVAGRQGQPISYEINFQLQPINTPVAGGKALARYLLFAPNSRIALLLAQDALRTTGMAAGFSVDDATQASSVVIVGDASGISTADEARLHTAGCTVQRLDGDLYTVESLLAQLGKGNRALLPTV